MGVIGGLLGSFFVVVNKNITILRAQLKMSRLAKSLEAALVGQFNFSVVLDIIYYQTK